MASEIAEQRKGQCVKTSDWAFQTAIGVRLIWCIQTTSKYQVQPAGLHCRDPLHNSDMRMVRQLQQLSQCHPKNG